MTSQYIVWAEFLLKEDDFLFYFFTLAQCEAHVCARYLPCFAQLTLT